MKKVLVATLIIAAMASSAPLVRFVRAQAVDLGVENVGLLPSNPFYFLKEWGRGVRKFFTSSSVRKARLEFDVVNEKAAELGRLVEITPNNKVGLVAAFDNYTLAVGNLEARLTGFTETVTNPAVSQLVGDILSRSIQHRNLFDQLDFKFSGDQAIHEAVSTANRAMAEMLAAIVTRVEAAGDFRTRFVAMTRPGADSLRGVTAVELAGDLAEILSGEDKDFASALKGDLLFDLVGHLEGAQFANPEGISDLITGRAGDSLTLLGIFDEARELTQNSDLHNTLSFSRPHFLGQLNALDRLNEATAVSSMERARAFIASVPASNKAVVREGLSRAKYNLEQAEKLFQEDNFEGAVGQASAAYATAKEAWYHLVPGLMGNSDVSESLRSYYDTLSAAAKDADFPSVENPKVFSYLTNIEKQLIGISKLIEGEARPELIAEATKSARVTLSMVDELIYWAFNPVSTMAEKSAPSAMMFSAAEVPVSATVVISNDGFDPTVLKVKVGTKVTWFNKDVQPHWPVADAGTKVITGFDAKNGLSQGETFSFTFDKAGILKYHDQLNPSLTGTVEVAE